jgi:feruloyl-CoA synthase
VLWAGGTVYLDEGKPIPGLFETTIKNLYEVSPVVFGSAPIAFSMLADAMEKDPALRRSFFKNLRYMAYGGATLSNDLYGRMQALAVAETGHRIPITTMYGATETQGITVVHWLTERVGLVGLPLPGITLKLVPNGSKYEVRVKGRRSRAATTTTPTRLPQPSTRTASTSSATPRASSTRRTRRRPDLRRPCHRGLQARTAAPGFCRHAPPRPGRRLQPYVHDMVIAGQDKPFAAALVWPSLAGLQALASEPGEGTPIERLNAIVAERLRAFNAGAGGSSRRIARFHVMLEPPSIDSGEITDKGYVNQRATLERRAALAARLFTDPPGEGVVVV